MVSLLNILFKSRWFLICIKPSPIDLNVLGFFPNTSSQSGWSDGPWDLLRVSGFEPKDSKRKSNHIRFRVVMPGTNSSKSCTSTYDTNEVVLLIISTMNIILFIFKSSSIDISASWFTALMGTQWHNFKCTCISLITGSSWISIALAPLTLPIDRFRPFHLCFFFPR